MALTEAVGMELELELELGATEAVGQAVAMRVVAIRAMGMGIATGEAAVVERDRLERGSHHVVIRGFGDDNRRDTDRMEERKPTPRRDDSRRSNPAKYTHPRTASRTSKKRTNGHDERGGDTYPSSAAHIPRILYF